jgi:fatty-acyl-CoA synthase
MSDKHFAFWPKYMPRHMTIPATSLCYNLEVSAARYPDKPYLVFYDSAISFAEMKDEVERLAGFLQQEWGVKKGDRVLLYTQNSPQFVIGYYAILRANAVVVPVNPMNLTNELRHYVSDSGAAAIITTQELYPQVKPLLGEGLDHALVGAYSDYLKTVTDLRVPEVIAAPRQDIGGAGVIHWSDALARDLRPGPVSVGPDDLCVMPYTSGTTGHPKGCMHTHRSVMHTLVAGEYWFSVKPDDVRLAVLPFFHVTGMQGSMNGPLFNGNTVVLLPRWDREAAAQLVQRYRVTSWTAIPTMVIDFLMNPKIGDYDLSSIKRMSGGGAAMPEAIAQKLMDLCGITYVEGYGLSETIAPTHINPPERPKKQCLGIPIFDTEARVVDPVSFKELPPGEVGEIIVSGPQVFLGYWNNPQASADAFVELEGKRFFRTGDLGRTDEDGYFFIVDRLKRMINASGYKVWPAEVEALMYQNPHVQEACIIAARDPRRGETVKAVVVLKPDARGRVSEQEIIDWAAKNMAAYKYPRIVEFVESLPKSATGKVMWRALQEREQAKA